MLRLPIPGRTRAPLAAAAVLAGAALLPGSSHAVATCQFDAAAGRVTIAIAGPGAQAVVDRSGTAIRVDGTPCGGATVNNTDTIRVTGGNDAQTLVIDLAGGRLAPGRSAETAGSPEIEVVHDLGSGFDTIAAKGGSGPEVLRIGSAGLDLLGDADPDVTADPAAATVDRWVLEGRIGDDLLTADGGFGTGAATSTDTVMSGGSGVDTLVGGSGDDDLTGGPGADTVDGRAGNNDVLREESAATGADVLSGGTGAFDRLEYDRRTADLAVDMDGAADDGAAGEGDDVAADLEIVALGSGDDRFSDPSGLYRARRVDGGAGADRITGGIADDDLRGDAGDDRLEGGAQGDELAGGAGDDDLYGGDGNDSFMEAELGETGPNGADDMIGGPGDADQARYDRRGSARLGAVTVDLDSIPDDGQAGEKDNVRADVEEVSGGAGADRLYGNRAANRLEGNGGDDFVSGGDGGDLVQGGAGRNRLGGGDGGDTIYGGDDGETISGGDGDDDVSAGGGPDSIDAGLGDDDVRGGFGDDTLVEGAAPSGADDLHGDGGTDRLDYSRRPATVVVALDAADADGSPAGTGERDNAHPDLERVDGGAGADEITGSAEPNTLIGGGGGDVLAGLGGDDSLDGGTGADDFDGGDGTDTLTYAARTLGVTGDLSGTLDSGNASDQNADGRRDQILADVENLTGGKGNDRLTGSDVRNAVAGGDGTDSLRGLGGADTLSGGAGDDSLEGGTGPDALAGDTGTDTATWESRSEDVTADLDGYPDDGGPADGPAGARDRVGLTVENLTGGSGRDRLTGNDGPNALRGGGGDDELDGKAGADDLDGEAGIDLATYATRFAGVRVTIDGAADDGIYDSSGDSEGDNVRLSTEGVQGGGGDDELTGSSGRNGLWGGPGDDELVGGGASDLLDGQGGADMTRYPGRTQSLGVTLDGLYNDGTDANLDTNNEEGDNVVTEGVEGGPGRDRIIGDGAGNRFVGGDGSDELDGRGGADALDGGPGADELLQGSAPDGADDLRGGDGTDTVHYEKRTGHLAVDAGDEQAFDGEPAVDEHDNVRSDVEVLLGGAGSDGIWGNAGPNRIDGGKGRDSLFGQGGADVLLEGDNDDTVIDPAKSSDDLHGGEGDDELRGSHTDEAYGDGGDDRFLQGPSRTLEEVIHGGSGSDLVDYGQRLSQDIVWLRFDGSGTQGANESDRIYPDVENARGGNGNDRMLGQPGCVTNRFEGGKGDDELNGGGGTPGGCAPDILAGGEHDDHLRASGAGARFDGGPGDDDEKGAAGADVFDQGTAANGADTITGGGGADEVTYAGRADIGVIVDIDGQADDGAPGEKDTIPTDIERLIGSPLGDVILGRTDQPDTLRGGEGKDDISGLTGNDDLSGEGGDDIVRGNDGNDKVRGGPGLDDLFGGDGADTLFALDGEADDLDGGPGSDGGSWDPFDTVVGIP